MSVRVLLSRVVWLAPLLACVLAACGGAPSINVGQGGGEGGGPGADDAGTVVDAGTCPGSGTCSGADAGAHPGTDAGAGTDVDAGSGSDAGTDSDAGTPTSLVVDAGPDVSLCAGGAARIGPAPEPGREYSWSPAEGLSSSSEAQPMASPGTTTTYVLTVRELATGRTGSDAVVVTVFPEPGSAGADLSLDPGASSIIGPTPVPGATHAWSCNRADCALSDPHVAQPVAGPTRTTTYALAASSGPGCDAQSHMTVWVNLGADTVPRDGETAFPLSSMLLVRFDQPIAPATLTSSTVLLQDALTGTPVSVSLSYDATNRELWVSPTGSNYVAAADYTLTLVGGPSGIASDDPIQPNLFPSDVQVDFTTAAADTTPPGITFRNPGVGATGVPGNTSVVVTFSEPVNPSTVTDTTFTLTGTAGRVAGSVHYDTSTWTATFTPSATLTSFTSFTVSLAGLQDLSGNALTTSANWSFTTGSAPDTTPPTVTSVSPANGATAVASSEPLLVTFSESVDATSLTGLRLLQVSTGTYVAGGVSYNATTRMATFTPRVLLGSLTPYEVQVSGVKDLAGNAMAAPFTSRFTTRQTLFADNFENGTGAWSLPAPTVGTPWSLTTANFHSSRNSLTDSAGGKYASNVVSYAELAAPLSVSGLTSVSVQFWMRARTERNKDYVYVDASIDGGAWTQLSGGRYSGNQAWAVRSLNLPLSGRSTLRIRFRFESNASKSFDGVYIDDVIIQSP